MPIIASNACNRSYLVILLLYLVDTHLSACRVGDRCLLVIYMQPSCYVIREGRCSFFSWLFFLRTAIVRDDKLASKIEESDGFEISMFRNEWSLLGQCWAKVVKNMLKKFSLWINNASSNWLLYVDSGWMDITYHLKQKKNNKCIEFICSLFVV